MRKIVAVLVSGALASASLFALAGTAEATLEPPVAFGSAAQSTWQTNGEAWTVAGAQGLAFVGGTFTSIRPPGAAAGVGEVARTNFAVFDAATGAPTTCAPAFEFLANPALASVKALAVSPDNQTLYIGGYFSSAAGLSRQFIAAMNISTCTILSSFQPLPGGGVWAITASTDAVYYTGQFGTVGGVTRSRAAAASAVGTATPGALLPWAPVLGAEGRAIALKPDNSLVVVGGDFVAVNGVTSSGLVVVNNTDGANVKTYSTSFIDTRSKVKNIVVDETGFYTANEGSGGGVFDGRLAVDWSTLDQRWRDTCLGATQALQIYQGVLYSGHHAHDCSSMGSFVDGPRYHFTAQSTTNAQPFLSWSPDTNDGINEQIGPRDLALAPSGSGDFLWAVGMFTTVNGVAQQGITRFSSGPDTAAPARPIIHLSSFRAGQVRVAWRTSLDFSNRFVTYKVYKNNSATPIYETTGLSYRWDQPQLSFTETGLTPGVSNSYRVDATDGNNTTVGFARSVVVAGSTTSYVQQVVADGAQTLLRHDEIGDVFVSDSIGDYNLYKQGAGTYQVNPGAIAGDPSSAFTLTGSNMWMYGNNRIPSPSTFSVEQWFKTTTTTGGKLIGFGNRQLLTSGQYDKHIYMQNNGRIRFGVFSGSTQTLESPTALNDGQWHHVVGTQGPSGISLYVDGVRVGRNTAVTTNESYPGFWRVGGDNLNSWPGAPTSRFFAGSIDETAIYPSALSDAQVASHYQAAGGVVTRPGPADFYGQTTFLDSPFLYWRLSEASGTSAFDSSGASRSGTYGSGVTLNQSGAISGTSDPSALLDGSSNGRVVSAQVPSPSTYSSEAWFKTTTSSGGRIMGFGSSQTGTSGQSDRVVYMRNDGRLAFGVNELSKSTITSASSYNDGAFHHVVATKGASGMVLYVDGQLVASNGTTANSSYNGFWRVGGGRLTGWPSNPSATSFPGTLDEFAVYSTALSASQVATHFSAGRSSAPDVAAPLVPFGVQAGIVLGDPRLTWSPSQDNVAVTGYDVHRSTVAGFTPGPANLVGSTATTTYDDLNAPVGTLYYRVVAKDAAGNNSAGSDQLSLILSDTKAPTAPSGVTALPGATDVSVSWAASTDNVGVVQYDVHRSSSAVFTPSGANLVASVPGTSHLDTPPSPGTWYYRVVAKDAAGNASVASPAESATLSDTLAPSEPSNVQASVAGSTVSVSWSASTDNVGVTGYDVHRSATSGFAPSPGTLVGSVTGTSFDNNSVPEGTWYYRVIAKDAAGNASSAALEVAASIAATPSVVTITPIADSFGNAGAPIGTNGTSSSLASRGNVGATSYMRFVIPTAPAGKTLSSAVLKIRTNTTASAGSLEPHTVQIAANGWDESTLAWNNRPALTGPVLGSITSAAAINTQYDTPLDVAGLQPLVGGQGTVAISNAGTDILWFWSREQTTPGFQPQLQLTFSPADVTAPSAPSGLGANVTGSNVALAWSASTDNVGVTGYDVYRSATSGFTPGLDSLVGSVAGTSFGESSVPPGTWYYRVIANDAAGNASAASTQTTAVIAAPDTEAPSAPAGLGAIVGGTSVALSWTASTDNVGVTGYDIYRSLTSGFTPAPDSLVGSAAATTFDNSSVPSGTWYYRVIAKDAAGNRSDPSAEATAVIDGPDTQDPSAPTGVSTNVTGNSVQVTWTAATDNVAVTGYDVYRSSTSGFTPAPGSLVGSAAGTTFTNNAVSAGTWYYRVVAKDAAGNRSAASAQASAVVAPPPPPTVLTINPIADAFGNAGAATATSGTATSLASRGTVGATAYLRFGIPSAPVGQTLTGAVLNIRTNTTASAGSLDSQTVQVAANGWDESTLNWTNRPALTGPTLGAITTAVASDTQYSTSLNAAGLQPLVGAQGTIAISSAGTDILWFWSKEHAAASYRPQLELTYSSNVVEPPLESAVVMGVGDIACQSGEPVTATTCRHADVAAAINAQGPNRFLGLGDLQYLNGSLSEFNAPGAYNATFGSLKSITLPVIGNHEQLDPAGANKGYFDYFYGSGINTGALGERGKGYYSSTIGSWKHIALNSECAPDAANGNNAVAGGCGVGSPQYIWLQNELASSPVCTMVSFHRPRWTSSASHTGYADMSAMWDLMATNGVDVAVSGHAHSSEIFKPIGVSGAGASPTLDPQGIRSFVAGGGGASLRAFNAPSGDVFNALDARDNTTFGAVKLTLNAGGYQWGMTPIAGQSFTNAGTSGSFTGSATCN